MAVRLLRVAYAIEFLITLIGALSVWRDVGGQYHLDLLPWFVKLLLPLGLAVAVVKLTAASAGVQKRRTLLWASVVMVLVLACGLITFYYHLNEPLDEEDETTTLTAV